MTAHAFTDHWNNSMAHCHWTNFSTRTCKCGYSYVYRESHTYSGWRYTLDDHCHFKSCTRCGTWGTSEPCKDANGQLLTCTHFGTCATCGAVYDRPRHAISGGGSCNSCGAHLIDISNEKTTYSADHKTLTWTATIKAASGHTINIPNDVTDYWCDQVQWGWVSHSHTNNSDGSITYKNVIKIKNSFQTSGKLYFQTKGSADGYSFAYFRFNTPGVYYGDITAPIQNDVVQKYQTSANGWATIKQLTLTGTEDASDTVWLTIADKATGEKYVTDAAVSVVDGKYSYTCTPSIEGDANGRTYVVTAKDRIGNTSIKEFVVSKTDGSAPQLKSGTSLTYTDWSTSKNISLSFFDFGAGGVEASLDNQTDYKALTKSSEYYVWNRSFGNQVGTTEHTIYVRDALGNATTYKFTVGNTDSNVYSVTYNLNGGSLSGQKTSYTVADSFTLPQPTRTGYTFTGWTGTGLSGLTKTVTVLKGSTGNLSYTANWSANNYYITFNGNGGSLNVMDGSIAKNNNGTATAKVQYDLNYYYSLGILATKPGYTFKEFYDAPSGGTQVFRVDGTTRCLSVASKYYNENSIWKYTGNVTFYAQWEPITWTIKYDSNGGSGRMADTTHIYMHGDKIRHNQFTRPGWTMTGWTYSRVRNSITEWMYGSLEGYWIDAEQWYEFGKNPDNTKIYVEHNLDGIDYGSTYIDGDIHIAHAQWSYNPVSVKVPQILTGDHTGKSQFRVKCDEIESGNIQISIPSSFSYKQAGKSDVTATITAKSGNNIITPTNKVCVYDITTKSGLSAGCWQGSFNIGLTLTKE